MAKRNASPNQIIRKDGQNCFVEALNSAFDIGKVHLKFVTYDKKKAIGSRFTNEIDIYIDIEKFLQISHDVLITQKLLQDVYNEKAIADNATAQTGSKVWAKQLILDQGGTSATSLSMSGKSRPDGKSLARVLKIFAGDKYPFMLKAESGPGETDVNGLIIPKYGYKPESYVQIGLKDSDVKEFFLAVQSQINAYNQIKLFTHKYEKRIKTLESQNKFMCNMLASIGQAVGCNPAPALAQYKQELEELNTVNYQKNSKPKYNNQSSPQPNHNQYYNQSPR